jgi:hypothetical protein
MKPSLWLPSVELSMQEEHIMKRIRKARLFVFLRHHRHELLDEPFRAANWRRSTGQVNEGNHLLPRRNWHWRSFCKPTPAFPMTK